VAEEERRTNRRRKSAAGIGRKAGFFGLLWTRFSPPSGYKLSLYL